SGCGGGASGHKTAAIDLPGDKLLFCCEVVDFGVSTHAFPSSNELKLGAHHHRPKQIGESRSGWRAGMGGVGQRGQTNFTFRQRRGAAEQIPIDAVYRFRRSLERGQRRHGRLGSGRRKPVEARLLIEDEETAGYAFTLNERLVFKEWNALEAGEA